MDRCSCCDAVAGQRRTSSGGIIQLARSVPRRSICHLLGRLGLFTSNAASRAAEAIATEHRMIEFRCIVMIREFSDDVSSLSFFLFVVVSFSRYGLIKWSRFFHLFHASEQLIFSSFVLSQKIVNTGSVRRSHSLKQSSNFLLLIPHSAVEISFRSFSKTGVLSDGLALSIGSLCIVFFNRHVHFFGSNPGCFAGLAVVII